MFVLLLKLVPWLVLVGSLVWAGFELYAWIEEGGRQKSDRFAGEKETARPRPGLTPQAILVLLALLGLVAFGTATEVAPTSVAVVENTWNGHFYQLEGGTHIWPFQPVLTPLVTKVYPYDLRRQIIEIGEPPAGAKAPQGQSATQAFGVASASDSPGQPVVFFRARGWAFVNKDMVITLHRRYGADYLNSWVEQQWITTLKSIQGRHAYDFIKANRVTFEDEVERALQSQLTVEDQKLVNVSQLAVVDYDYEDKINKFLQNVAEQEFARQVAEQQAQVNQKKQDAARIEVETTYITTKRTAEAQAAKQIAEADGQAKAITLVAEAQAEANRKINASLTELLVQYNLVKEWNGLLPTFYSGAGNPLNVLFNMPWPATVPITSTTPVTTAAPTK